MAKRKTGTREREWAELIAELVSVEPVDAARAMWDGHAGGASYSYVGPGNVEDFVEEPGAIWQWSAPPWVDEEYGDPRYRGWVAPWGEAL